MLGEFNNKEKESEGSLKQREKDLEEAFRKKETDLGEAFRKKEKDLEDEMQERKETDLEEAFRKKETDLEDEMQERKEEMIRVRTILETRLQEIPQVNDLVGHLTQSLESLRIKNEQVLEQQVDVKSDYYHLREVHQWLTSELRSKTILLEEKEEGTRKIEGLNQKLRAEEERTNQRVRDFGVALSQALLDRNRSKQDLETEKGKSQNLNREKKEEEQRASQLRIQLRDKNEAVERLTQELSIERENFGKMESSLADKNKEIEKLSNIQSICTQKHFDYDALKSESSKWEKKFEDQKVSNDELTIRVNRIQKDLETEKGSRKEATRLYLEEKDAHELLKNRVTGAARLPPSPGEEDGSQRMNQAKRRKADETVSGRPSTNEIREWREHISTMIVILQDLRPLHTIDLHVVWYEMSRCIGETKDCLERLQEYKDQQPRERLL